MKPRRDSAPGEPARQRPLDHGAGLVLDVDVEVEMGIGPFDLGERAGQPEAACCRRIPPQTSGARAPARLRSTPRRPRGSRVWLSWMNSPEMRILCHLALRFLYLRDVIMLARRSVRLAAGSIFCVSLLALAGLRAASETLPPQLTDQEFWKLERRVFRAGRHLPIRQPAVERGLAPARHSRTCCQHHQDAERLHGRRARAELHLHRRAQAEDGVHRRHPPRQPRSAVDVQGAVRAVGRPRRVRLAAVLEEAARRPRPQRHRRSTSSTAYQRRRDERRRCTRRT